MATDSKKLALDPAISLDTESRIVADRNSWYHLPWLNPADAALLASRMTLHNECSIRLHVVRSPIEGGSSSFDGGLDVFDIVALPSHNSTSQNLLHFLSIGVLSSRPRRLPSFEFPAIESHSPSSTYHWRSGILLPLILYIVIPIFGFFLLGAMVILVLRIARRFQSGRRRKASSYRRTASTNASPHRSGLLMMFWRPSSPTPSFPNVDRDSVMGRLWRDALTRGKLRSSAGLQVPSGYQVIDDEIRSRGRNLSPEKRLSTIMEEAP